MNVSESIQIIKSATQASLDLLFYASITLIPIGFVLNLLSLVIFSRKKFRSLRIGIIYRAITIADLVAILFCFLIYFSPTINNDLQIASDISCKLLNLFMRTCAQSSSWINLLLTIDRFLLIKYSSKKFKLFHNETLLPLIIVGIFIFIAMANSSVLWFNVIERQSFNQTTKICMGSQTALFFRDLMAILFRTVLPFILIFILNTILIKAFVEQKQKVSAQKTMRKEMIFAFSIIIMNSFYFVNLIPIGVSLIFYNIYQNDPVKFSIVTFYSFLAMYITALNNCFPFIINLIFNKIFYREFFDFLGIWFPKAYLNKSSLENSKKSAAQSSTAKQTTK
ncbi:unnamed protein product [Brachionus calyciflorus]|uniref:G-protein coupled receptors family 1 profile domain-containing protein n=1 Tax=Brachionus calyciflorus TaxID=104777 RepID=A0A813M5M4_9BILA|nr:unnamed protein product [Brachionus calyciflorus]